MALSIKRVTTTDDPAARRRAIMRIGLVLGSLSDAATGEALKERSSGEDLVERSTGETIFVSP